MRMLAPVVYRIVVICILLLGQLAMPEETVYKARVKQGQICSGGAEGSPGSCSETISNGELTNSQPVPPTFYRLGPVCTESSRSFNLASCMTLMNGAVGSNAFTVYRKDEIDDKTKAIDSQLDDLGTKVNSLNKRMVDDESALPAAIDQYAVQKLQQEVDALEARIKVLEGQTHARQ